MATKRNAFRAFVLGIIAAAAVGSVVGQIAGPEDRRRKNIYEPLVYVIRQIDANYVTPVDYDKLLSGAYSGMLSRLDEFSEYIPPKRFREFQVDTKGEFGGLGIRIRFNPIEKVLSVESPIPGTPAARAGILAGDRIIKIYDENADPKETKAQDLEDVYDAVKKMRGTPGTKITITIVHEGGMKPVDYTITRGVIKIPGVRAERIVDKQHKIGYLYIAYFHEHTVPDMQKAIKKLVDDGVKALIVDLRFNPGGLLKTAVELSDVFLSEGKIVSTRGRRFEEKYTAKAADDFPDIPLVVLVNKYSASASEIFAAAIKDNKRGIIVGEKTFGKGSVQTLIKMPDNQSALKLTTAYYYTPSGANIHKKGIEPDIKVEISLEDTRRLVMHLSKATDFVPTPKNDKSKDEKDKKEEPFKDVQLERAVDIAKGILVYANLNDK